MIIKLCLVCGKEFKTYKSKIDAGRGKYCGKYCSDKKTLFTKGIKQIHPGHKFEKGILHYKYKGYRFQQSRKNGNKYKMLYMPDYIGCDKKGYIREHRYIIEKKIGRVLYKNEIVHHIDGNTLNNSIDNLCLMNKIDHDRMNVNLNIHKRWKERGDVISP